MAKTKITTETGFKCEVDPAALDDMRVLEEIIKMQDTEGKDMEKMKSVFKVLTLLLGESGKNKLYDFVAKRDGHPSVSGVSDELGAIFKALGETPKKS